MPIKTGDSERMEAGSLSGKGQGIGGVHEGICVRVWEGVA